MKKLLLGLIVILASCTTEKVNIIKGKIEGLKAGDKVYLTVGGAHYGNRYLSDSVIVQNDGEFTLKTKVSDANVKIYCFEPTGAFTFNSRHTVGFFLEGYSTLDISANISKQFSDLRYSKITGGLYAMPEMKALQRNEKEKIILKEKSNQIFDKMREMRNINLLVLKNTQNFHPLWRSGSVMCVS